MIVLSRSENACSSAEKGEELRKVLERQDSAGTDLGGYGDDDVGSVMVVADEVMLTRLVGGKLKFNMKI